jgi:uncharacterized membrane protein YedE/YeeE
MRYYFQMFNALLVGIVMGIFLTKSEVISWFRIQAMFRGEEPYMYQVIASAIAVAAFSLWLIKRFQLTTIYGEPIVIKKKTYHRGVIIGGFIFGCGWAMTGACPGPIYAQIGSGEYVAIVTFFGALLGTYLFAYVRPRLM